MVMMGKSKLVTFVFSYMTLWRYYLDASKPNTISDNVSSHHNTALTLCKTLIPEKWVHSVSNKHNLQPTVKNYTVYLVFAPFSVAHVLKQISKL